MPVDPQPRHQSLVSVATTERTARRNTATTEDNDSDEQQEGNNSLTLSVDPSKMVSRVASMDYSFGSFDLSSVAEDPWVCSQCSYQNICASNEPCALCGTKDMLPFKESERSTIKQPRKVGRLPASLLNTFERPKAVNIKEVQSYTTVVESPDSPTESSTSSHSSEGSLPHQPQQVEDRRTLLQPSNSSQSFPNLIRPSADDDTDDVLSQPSMPQSVSRLTSMQPEGRKEQVTTGIDGTNITANSAVSTMGPSLTGSSLGALVRHVSKEQAKKEYAEKYQSRSTSIDEVSLAASTVTQHSRKTVKMSNRSNLSSSFSSSIASSPKTTETQNLFSTTIDQVQPTESDSKPPSRSFTVPSDIPKEYQGHNHIKVDANDRKYRSLGGSQAPIIFDVSKITPVSNTLRPPIRKESTGPTRSSRVTMAGGSVVVSTLTDGNSRSHSRNSTNSKSESATSDSLNRKVSYSRPQSGSTSPKIVEKDILSTVPTHLATSQSEPSTHSGEFEKTMSVDMLERGYGNHIDTSQSTSSVSSSSKTNRWSNLSTSRMIQLGLSAFFVFFTILLIVILVIRKEKGSPTEDLRTTNSDPFSPEASPVSTELQLAAILDGDPSEFLGSSVSTGGPLGDWIAVVGGANVRVLRFNPTREALETMGQTLQFSTDVSGVSLSAERRRMAVAHSGQLTILERSTEADDNWRTLVDASQIGEWQGLIVDKTSISTACDISGSGLVAAGGAILHTSKGSFASVRSFQLEAATTVSNLVPLSFPVDPNAQRIDIALSYDGNTLAVLADNSVRVYRLNEFSEWILSGGQGQFAGFNRIISAMVMSGNSQWISVTAFDQTVVYKFNEEQEEWILSQTLPTGGSDLSMSYEGDSLLLGIDVEATEKGKIALFERNLDDGIFEIGDEKLGVSELSLFGKSVSIPKNRQWDVLTVGAPMEGSSENGSLTVYKQVTKSTRRGRS